MSRADTSADAAARQLDVLRRLTPAQRAQLTVEMSEQSFEIARRGVWRRHPEYDDEDTRLAMLRLLQGDDVVLRIYPDEPLRAM